VPGEWYDYIMISKSIDQALGKLRDILRGELSSPIRPAAAEVIPIKRAIPRVKAMRRSVDRFDQRSAIVPKPERPQEGCQARASESQHA